MVLLDLLDPCPRAPDQIALAVIVLILSGLYDDKASLVIVRVDEPRDIEVKAGPRHFTGGGLPSTSSAPSAGLSGGIDSLGRQLAENICGNDGLGSLLVKILLHP